MLFTLLPGTAFAADGAQAENAGQQSDVKRVFNSNLFVAPNAAAGLSGTVRVDFDALGTLGTLYLPGSADAAQLCFSWDDPDITVSKDGVVYASGTAPIAPVGGKVTYKIKKGLAVALVTVKTLQGSSDVEPLFLELDEDLGTIDAMNGDESHETECFGRAQFGSINKPISIKGRGNSTWKMPKKPYNITFYKADDYSKKDKTEMIPGVKAKKWSLIANYLDNSLLRNKIAMDLANDLGIGLQTRFVDVWMNGEYLGNYLLTPKNDYLAPDEGYVLESDNYYEHGEGSDPQFKLPGDDAADAGVDPAAIESYCIDAWAALRDYGSEDYQNYFDLDSWAKMFLMYEVSKTYDCYAGSLLMHRDGLTENDKLIAGPAWDYDVSFGRTLHKFLVGVSEPIQLNAEGWYNDSIGLLAVDKPVSILQELGKHPSFMQHVAKIYNDYLPVFEGIAANVDVQREILRASADMNNDLWGTHSLSADYLVAPGTMHLLGTGKYALNYQVTVNWDAYVNNVREFATKRVMWLTDHLTAAEAPAGSVSRAVGQDGDVLTVTLTAGNQNNTYQWQRSADGSVWEDVANATEPTLRLTAGDTAQYRCIVANAGPVISTTHGGDVPTFSRTVLDAPAAATGTVPPVIDPAAYPNVSYNCYTYLGDSISWGYGLHSDVDNHDPYNVGRRVDGAFTDIVADVIEAHNPDAVIHAAASSGARLCDFRILLEQGMHVENPYTVADDWYGQRHPERTERLRAMGDDVVQWLGESDLVTVQVGINDLSAALVNALYSTGVVDLNKLSEIEDLSSATDYLKFVLGNLVKDPDVFGNFVRAFNRELEAIRENTREIIKDIEYLAPNADIVIVGYHKAVQTLRVLPGEPFSPIFDLADTALVSLNDYFETVAGEYGNVYYVDAPDASIIYEEGTDLFDILKDVGGFLKGVHPDAAGHEYIAHQVLAELEELTHCHHTNTKNVNDPFPIGVGTEYISKVVCADCGKVLSSAKIRTPFGDIPVPSITIDDAVDTAKENAARLIPFSDVLTNDWFQPHVQYVYENGLMNGRTADVFAPGANTTRAEFATVLYRMAGSPKVTAAAPFADVSGHWASDAVAWAYSQGIVNGVSPTAFAPDANVTREQMVTMLYRFLNKPAVSGALTGMTDAGAVSDYATQAMLWAVQNGVINGRTPTTLVPQGEATRAELAAILTRVDKLRG